MNVVLDTNIFVSGIHWHTTSRKVLDMWLSERFVLVSSLEIISEVTSTLKNFKIPLTEKDLAFWENLILEKSLLVEPSERLEIVKDDSDDDMFLEVAVSGKAEYIVSQDKHLLKLKEFRGIKIISPEEFCKTFKI